MYRVVMRKVIGGERVRTDEVVGTSEQYPKVGDSFVIMAPSLYKFGSFRVVSTSPVEQISNGPGDTVIIKTANSIYSLDITYET